MNPGCFIKVLLINKYAVNNINNILFRNTMAEALYLEDSYLKEFEAKVISVTDGKFIVLDKTAFYPNSGGQPHDIGIIVRKSDNKEFKVTYTGKFKGEISHEIENPEGDQLKEGDEITGKINWETRYEHMKMHTAAHVVSEASNRITGAMITGNQLGAEQSRIDGNFDYSPEKVKAIFEEANKVVKQDLPVTCEFISRKDAEEMPLLTKLAKGLPPEVDNIRIISIGDYEKGADGGTHVKSTKEIGKIVFVKYASKGKDNKRIYFKLE